MSTWTDFKKWSCEKYTDHPPPPPEDPSILFIKKIKIKMRLMQLGFLLALASGLCSSHLHRRRLRSTYVIFMHSSLSTYIYYFVTLNFPMDTVPKWVCFPFFLPFSVFKIWLLMFFAWIRNKIFFKKKLTILGVKWKVSQIDANVCLMFCL
jgi:hypothetical protein